MSPFDLHHDIAVSNAFSSATINTDTTTYGEIIDTAGYTALEFVLKSGTITDGAYAVTLQEGDDSGLSDAAAVAADDTLGDADFALADDNTAKRIGYIGGKRYARLKIVSTSTSSGGLFSGIAIRKAVHMPVAD